MAFHISLLVINHADFSLPEELNWLSQKETAQLNTRRHATKKREFLVSRFAMKAWLEANGYGTLDKHSLTLCEQTGLLIVENEDNTLPRFSLSHSRNYIAIGCVNQPEAAGNFSVDIECPKPHRDIMAIAEASFSTEELDNAISEASFYSLWTQKEALCKLSQRPLTDILGQPVSKLTEQLNARLKTLHLAHNLYLAVATSPAHANMRVDVSYIQSIADLFSASLQKSDFSAQT